MFTSIKPMKDDISKLSYQELKETLNNLEDISMKIAPADFEAQDCIVAFGKVISNYLSAVIPYEFTVKMILSDHQNVDQTMHTPELRKVWEEPKLQARIESYLLRDLQIELQKIAQRRK